MRPAFNFFALMYFQIAFVTGKMPFNSASGEMMRPAFNFFALMYFQIAFVTSTLLSFALPQILARAGESVFGAKRPMPFFFATADAFFEPAERLRRTCARWACFARMDMPVFVVFVVAVVVVVAVVFVDAIFFVAVVLVILSEERKNTCTLGDGDLCTMEGMFQKHFQHRVPKEDR